MSEYFGFRNHLNVSIDEKWRGYKTLLFLLAANPRVKVADVLYVFKEREKGGSKIVNGFRFIRTYMTEILLVTRVEHRYKT
ncbi:hypothetical protein [Thermoplasma acidophilum]|nr:hypothetical protein [Thermoplasma acidophilum]